MLTKTITLTNKFGLQDVRATRKWLQTVRHFASKVTLNYNGKDIDAKNIGDLMRLATQPVFKTQKSLEVTVQGKDERAALSALEKLVKDKFGEEE
jgi:phosphocarrier protein